VAHQHISLTTSNILIRFHSQYSSTKLPTTNSLFYTQPWSEHTTLTDK